MWYVFQSIEDAACYFGEWIKVNLIVRNFNDSVLERTPQASTTR